MGPQDVWPGWAAEISRVLSSMGERQRRVLALFSLGSAVATHCGLARVAAVVPGLAVVPSSTRRFERRLANRRRDVRAARDAVVAAVLGRARGPTRWLALDAPHQGRTDTGARRGMLALRLVSREQAIPLAWSGAQPGRAPGQVPILVGRLIDEGAARVPPGTQVVRRTDRGRSWPSLLDRCQRVGWSFRCRVQRQPRVETANGRAGTIGDLAPHPGTRWRGQGRAFLKAGWRDLNLVAVWRRGDDQPWLLVTDRDPTRERCTQDRHRMDAEASFRDDTSAGFDGDASRGRDPAHRDRLLRVLHRAALVVLVQRAFVLHHGSRHVLARTDRTTLSLSSLGLRSLDPARSHRVSLLPSLDLPFP